MGLAAGILMMIAGIALLIYFVSLLIQDGVGGHGLTYLNLAMVTSTPFFVPGGVFCLRREYWKVCLASASLAAFIMIVWLTGHAAGSVGLAWVVSMMGTFPTIFTLLKKNEWQEV